jgi:PAS domain S-box-containing protein
VRSSAFALAAAGIAFLSALLIRPLAGHAFFLVFLAATFLSTWYGGVLGGLVAATLCTAAEFVLFLPAGSPGLPKESPALSIVSGLAISLLIIGVTAAWQQSRRQLAVTLSSIGDGVIMTDARGHITFINPVAELLTGWPRAAARGRPVAEVLKLINEQSREPVENLIERALREGATVHVAAHTLLTAKDGAEVPIEVGAGPIRDERGRGRATVLVFRDITGRRQLDEQLSQSQKMEAAGRLAAGMAGDFNNVLTVIAGYADLMRSGLPESNPLRRFADEIFYAGERAAGMTNRLLAFSRGQAAQPKVLDLNSILRSMEPMLRRLLSQNIELILLPGSTLGAVFADPSQSEEVVLNLATNARDAMPRGGKLVLETANVDLEDTDSSKRISAKPGPYVLLAVSDTGVGMDPAVRSRVFEPFFTTKEQGKGGGMGLSMVYGIVKQSGGYITVYSQVDCGTIFEIYLPRVRELPEKPAVRPSAVSKGSETILLVEDEEGVRKLVHAILESKGYSVLEASNGVSALSAYEKNAHKIDLVLTDVVMPQMNGFELARSLAEKRNGLKILFMSGYRDNPIAPPGGGQPRDFLQKPFTPEVLLNKVRDVLDSPA